MNLCDIRTVRDILSAFGTATKKNFGQNFLIERQIPEEIAENCCDGRECVIVEIGPGIGCLTAELARRYRRVIAFEIDKTLIPVLKYTLGQFHNVEVINADIMEVDLAALLAEKAAGERISVCANLPYYITTPILMRLLECGVHFDSITVMVQAEVADRLTATPKKGDYGAITVAVRYYGEPRLLFPVGRDNFLPAPKVDSAVVRIDLYPDKPVKPKPISLRPCARRSVSGAKRWSTLCPPVFPISTKQRSQKPSPPAALIRRSAASGSRPQTLPPCRTSSFHRSGRIPYVFYKIIKINFYKK